MDPLSVTVAVQDQCADTWLSAIPSGGMAGRFTVFVFVRRGANESQFGHYFGQCASNDCQQYSRSTSACPGQLYQSPIRRSFGSVGGQQRQQAWRHGSVRSGQVSSPRTAFAID